MDAEKAQLRLISTRPVLVRELVYRSGIRGQPNLDFHRDADRLIKALNELLG